MPRYFTDDEANSLLPDLAPLLEKIQWLKGRMDSLGRELEGMAPGYRHNGHSQQASWILHRRRQMRRLWNRLNTALQRAHSLGVEVKDVDGGLVDFPSLRAGREVYLCWRLGEDRVGHWHEKDSGFQGRQTL